MIRLKVKGVNCKKFFNNESGNHKWQRVSPTEKRGRVHTSSVTVAISDNVNYHFKQIPHNELNIKFTKASGPGGQNVNKRNKRVVIVHLPTGISVKEDSRSQAQNKVEAIRRITEKVNDLYRNKFTSKQTNIIASQSNRADKRRTYRVKDDVVIDHLTGKSTKLKWIMRGKIELLQ